jgi:hypothetical protein
LARNKRDVGEEAMFWTMLVIELMLIVIVIGQMGGGFIHLMLAVAMMILVIQLFSVLFSPDKTET